MKFLLSSVAALLLFATPSHAFSAVTAARVNGAPAAPVKEESTMMQAGGEAVVYQNQEGGEAASAPDHDGPRSWWEDPYGNSVSSVAAVRSIGYTSLMSPRGRRGPNSTTSTSSAITRSPRSSYRTNTQKKQAESDGGSWWESPWGNSVSQW